MVESKLINQSINQLPLYTGQTKQRKLNFNSAIDLGSIGECSHLCATLYVLPSLTPQAIVN